MRKYLTFLLISVSLMASVETDRLFKLAKIDQIFLAFKPYMKASITKTLKENPVFPPNMKQRILKIDTIFDPKKMTPIALKLFAQHFNDAQAKKINEWFNTPLGQRVAQAELRVFELENYNKFLKDFDIKKIDAKKHSLIKKIAEDLTDTQTHEYEKELYNLSFYSIIDLLSIEQRTHFLIENTLPYLESKEALEKEAKEKLNLYLFTYKPLDNKTLQSYINFSKTTEGKVYQQQSEKIIIKVILSMVEDFKKKMLKKLEVTEPSFKHYF